MRAPGIGSNYESKLCYEDESYRQTYMEYEERWQMEYYGRYQEHERDLNGNLGCVSFVYDHDKVS